MVRGVWELFHVQVPDVNAVLFRGLREVVCELLVLSGVDKVAFVVEVLAEEEEDGTADTSWV